MKTLFLGDENTVFVRQKDYIFFLGGSPSARNPTKYIQNLTNTCVID